MAVRTQNGNVLLRDGRVSCECCGLSCSANDTDYFFFGENLQFATLIPITQEERRNYLTNGITISQQFSQSPFALVATRDDGTKHEITGGTVAATLTGIGSALCKIETSTYLTWQVTDLFSSPGRSQRLNTFTATNSIPFYSQIRFLDAFPNHLLFGFHYTQGIWDLLFPLLFPYNLLYVIDGTTQEVDKSQFIVSYSSFAPGFTDFILSPTELEFLPSGQNFSVTSGITVNGVSVPINDPTRYFFKHVPSENSIVPQGTYELNNLLHQINLAVTIAPLTSPP
jgi:hypothetical protein